MEQAVARELGALLGPQQLKFCVWDEDRFVLWEGAPAPSDEPKGPAALQAEGPGYGDFLVTMGLDWDYPYSRQLHALSRQQGLRIIGCCYDLIPVLFPHFCVGDVARRFTEYFSELSWGAEAVLCISRRTESDFLRLGESLGAPRPITEVIPLGDNLVQDAGTVGEAVQAVSGQRYVLFVATIERRKNHEALYRAYRLLLQRGTPSPLPKLVFVGMIGWRSGDLLNDLEQDPLTRGLITILSEVSDAELQLLYRNALFCVYPSYYEGWGLPVGEALAAGKAVIASDQGSLPEVGGALVRYVAPWDTVGWADALADWVAHPELVQRAEAQIRDSYRPRRWRDTAQALATLLKRLAAQPPAAQRSWQPGQDMASLVGVRMGPSVHALGLAGTLVYGPRWTVPAGRIRLAVKGLRHAEGSEQVAFHALSAGGMLEHGAIVVDVAATEQPGVLADWAVELPHAVDDFELRCEVRAGSSLRLDEIELHIAPQADGARSWARPLHRQWLPLQFPGADFASPDKLPAPMTLGESRSLKPGALAFDWMLGRGFHPVESWAAWSSALVSELQLPVHGVAGQHLQAELEVQCFEGLLPACPVWECHFQGQLRAVILFRPSGCHAARVALDLVLDDDAARLTFRMTDLQSPLSLGMGEDARMLGFALTLVDLQLSDHGASPAPGLTVQAGRPVLPVWGVPGTEMERGEPVQLSWPT
jgi:glycosyltransferase involved in cell wall biosynthesis